MAMSILESYSFPRYTGCFLMFRVLGTSVATMPCIQQLDPQFCELSPLLCVRARTHVSDPILVALFHP